jgi:hypothetical protein
MDTSRPKSFTSLRQVNDRLFNHSVHLSRPENREQRRQLSRGLRELRHRRLNDIRDRYEALYDEGDDNE